MNSSEMPFSSPITALLNKLFPKEPVRSLWLALDSAGRTTALYKIKLGEVMTTIPTIAHARSSAAAPSSRRPTSSRCRIG